MAGSATHSQAAGHYMATSPFWQATRDGRLLLQYCPRSGRYQYHPRPTSLHTGRRALEWREASGTATLVAWTVDRLSPPAPDGPRIHALVDLPEQVRLLTWLVNATLDALQPGQALGLHWVELPDGSRWPAFAPR